MRGVLLLYRVQTLASTRFDYVNPNKSFVLFETLLDYSCS